MTAVERLAEIEARAAAATEGPWETFESGTLSAGCLGVDDSTGGMVLWHHDYGIVGGLDVDAEFIAAARTDVPALTAALRAVLELMDQYEKFDRDPRNVYGLHLAQQRVKATRAAVTAALDVSS